MTSRPWYAFYPADYQRDTAHLSILEHGAYRLLLDHYYETGGPITTDHRALYRILRCNSRQEKDAIRLIIGSFFVVAGDRYSHPRADKELARMAQISQKRSASAKQMHSKSSANAEQMHTQSQSQSQSQEDTPSYNSGDAPALKKKSRASMPEGFPFQADLDWSIDYWLKKGRADLCSTIGEEVERFHDHHNGKLTSSADWAGSWRTWARNAIKFNNGAHNGRRGQKLPTAHDNLIAGAADLIADIRAKTNGHS